MNTLFKADSATLNISNQKNVIMSQTLHYKSTGNKGAMEDLEHRVYQIMSNKGT